MKTYVQFKQAAGQFVVDHTDMTQMTQPQIDKYNEIYNPSPSQAALDEDWNAFQKEMGPVWNNQHVNGFDLSDQQIGRLNEYGQNKYKTWNRMLPHIQFQNDQQRNIHTNNMNKFYAAMKQMEQQLGRKPTQQEIAGLKASYDRDNGIGSADRAIAYGVEVQNRERNKMTAGDYFAKHQPNTLAGSGQTTNTTTTATDPADTPEQGIPWYSRMYQMMQQNPGMSAGLAALLAGGGLFALGSGGRRRNWGPALLLALLGGGATYWGMNKWLSPATQTAESAPAANTTA